MNEKRRINITLSLNSKYMRYAYVMLTSLFENQPDSLDIHVYLLHSDLTEEDRSHLGNLVKSYGGKVYWCPVDAEVFSANLPVSANWSLETYYRLLLVDILPEDVERIIYLDVDIIINHSLEDLFFTDLDGKLLGACEDINKPPFGDNRDAIFSEQIQNGFTYFCAGVMLLNIKDLRGKYCFRDYMALAEKMDFKMAALDQDLLNYMHWKEVKLLDGTKYSMFARSVYYFDNIHYDDAKKLGSIVHFIGRKPWEGQYIHYDIEQLWWDYAKLTPFYYELMEEYIYNAVHDPVLLEEERRIHEELDNMRALCRRILAVAEK